MKESVKDQELEVVVGGTAEEIDAIIRKFRYYGYDQQADRLVKSGSIRFGDTLSKILEEMGFPYKLTLYADYEQQNLGSLDGGFAGHLRIMDALDDFLYHLKNGINW